MKSMMKKQFPYRMAQAVACTLLLAGAMVTWAQAPKPFRGTITAISGNTLSVKTDVDGIQQVNVPATATLKRVAPGQTDLKSAETIPFTDLAVGDRVFVTPDPTATNATTQALRIIAMKQSDLALKQQKDLQDWQQRGVSGLVKSVDAASGVIVLNSGLGTTAKTITVHTAKTTILRRYTPPSVRTVDARNAPIDAIQPGDQLHARGAKSADGSQIDAEEVVSGTFRNIAGTIVSLDTTNSTLVVKDLATKKPVTIHITADAQMRRLEDRMAQFLAMRLKGSTGAAGAGGNGPAGGQRGGGPGGGQWASRNGGQGGGISDPQQALNRAPAIQLGDLQKGEAVMLVAIEGTTEVTAVTLFAGVEPLLEAPAATQNLLSNWSMNSGAGAAEAAAQ